MKKALKVVGILFVALIIIPLLAGAIGGAVLDIVAAVYLIALLASPIILICALIRRRRRHKANGAAPQEPAARQMPAQHVKVTKSASVPVAKGEHVSTESEPMYFDEDDGDIAYRYKNVGVFVLHTDVFGHPALVEGASVTFRQEPENTYDHNAVAVVIGRKRIGYLYRGKLQDMANDWLERGDTVCGRVVRVDPNIYDAKNNAVKINMYFYN